MKTRRARKLYKIAHRLRVQEQHKRPIWDNPAWDKQSIKAVKRYEEEMEKARIQAAWVMRCVKTHFAPFPTVEEYSVSNGRVWHRDSAPAFLTFDLDEFLSYVISQMIHHGACSEEHETARVTLRLLLRKNERKGEGTQVRKIMSECAK